MKTLSTLLVCATATLAAGCVGDDFSHVERGSQAVVRAPEANADTLIDVDALPELPPDLWESAIVNGAAESAEPATALLLALDQNQQVFSICSGTLIAPQRVLTAAHCIDDNVNAAGFGVYFGTDATLENDPGFVFFTQATQVVFHPAWNPNDLEAGNDIGLVFLAEAPPIAPIPIRTTPLSNADLNEPVKLVGWGITAGGGQDSGLKRSTISELHAFDDKLMQVGDENTGTCSGDSGGPAFMNINGQVQVVGVTSFGDVNCQFTSVDTRVDAFTTFITSDGQNPGGGGGADNGEFGASCESGDDCLTGLCAVSTDGTGFCTQECDAGATGCPGGFECVEAQPGLNVCLAGADDGEGGGGGFPIPPREDEGGCSVGGKSSAGSGLLMFAMMLIGWRRRRG